MKIAFLSGDVDPGRLGADAIYVDLPPDIKAWLKLGSDEAVRLRNAVYGLINAPLKWHQRLSRALNRVGLIPLQMDECVWILAEDIKTDKAQKKKKDIRKHLWNKAQDNETEEAPLPRKWRKRRQVHGLSGVHVDDLIGGDNHYFKKARGDLKKALEFGAWETKFRFRG